MSFLSALKLAFTSGTFIVVVFAVYYQAILRKLLLHGGYWRLRVEGINNEQCERVLGLEACEKLVLLRESGLVYLSCSNPTRRTFWEPATGRLNVTGRSLVDHVAFYDPSTSRVTRLTLTNYPFLEPLALQSFDIVPSENNPSEHFLFLINHRPPSIGLATKGADSVIEIFKTHEGSPEMEHVRTIRDPEVIITPSDIVGNGDGSFYFTNNARSKAGIMRSIDALIRLRTKSIGYCTYKGDCTLAAIGLPGASGIIRDPDGIFYVSNNEFGEITLLEQLDDKSLNIVDTIHTDMPMDKLSLNELGDIIHVAAFPKRLQAIRETLNDPFVPSASAVFRITRNTGDDQFYGKKFKIDKIFQDDGFKSSLSTTAAYDAKRGVLYTSGSRSQFLSICKI